MRERQVRMHISTGQEETTKRPRESRVESQSPEPPSQVPQARRLFDSRTPILLKKRQAAAINTPSGKRYIAVLGYFQRLQSEYRRRTALQRLIPLESVLDALALYNTPDPATDLVPALVRQHRTSQLFRSVPLPEADGGDSASSSFFRCWLQPWGHWSGPGQAPTKCCRLPSCSVPGPPATDHGP
jgi:hypothetical protein